MVHRSFYDANNRWVEAVIPEVQNLIPQIRKHTYAPDVDPAELISEEAVFQALTSIDWTIVDFQPLDGEEEAEPARWPFNVTAAWCRIIIRRPV